MQKNGSDLFEFTQQIYGKHLRVEFLQKLRDEEKFLDVAALKRQIALDVENAKKWFRSVRVYPADLRQTFARGIFAKTARRGKIPRCGSAEATDCVGCRECKKMVQIGKSLPSRFTANICAWNFCKNCATRKNS